MADNAEQGRKRMGRPPKRPELGARLNAMFRLNAVTRDRLMQTAEANGRSMSEEIEYRVEKSFHEKDLIELVRSVGWQNATQALTEFQYNSVGGELNFKIGCTFAGVLHGMQINADNMGGDRDWTRDRVKALVEERGASEMIPALLAHFPFPPDTNPHPEDVARKKERERTEKLYAQKAMQQAEKSDDTNK